MRPVDLEDAMFRGYRTLSLNRTQRAELARVRDTDKRPYLRERAAALLKIAEGWSAHCVATEGLLKARKPDTVYRWLNRYEQQGLPGLMQRPRGHRGFSPLGRPAVAGDRSPASFPARD